VRDDERHASEDVTGPDSRSDLVLVVDPVLEREDARVRLQQWSEQTHRIFRVVGLHAEEHRVAGADLVWVIARLHRDREVAIVGAD
jgi:hypothetical protein